MAVGEPYWAGYTSQPSGQNTIQFSFSSPLPQEGDLLWCIAGSNSATGIALSATDTAGTSWAKRGDNAPTAQHLSLLTGRAARDYTSADTLTVTYSGTGATKSLSVGGCPGAQPEPLRATFGGSTSASLTPASEDFGPVPAGAALLGAGQRPAAGTTVTGATFGFASLINFQAQTNQQTAAFADVAGEDLASVTAGITSTVSQTYGVLGAAFPAIPEPPPPPPPPPPATPSWRPVIPLPGQWSFWADEIVPPYRAIGPVAVAGFSATRVLNGFGAGEAQVILSESAVDRRTLLFLWGWRLWCYGPGGALWWCGVPTGVADTGQETVTVSLKELPGYLEHSQLAYRPGRMNQWEQTTIAATLAEPVTRVGVQVITQPGPGFPRDREYTFLEGQHRLELLQNLSNVIEGPEFRSEYLMQAGRPACRLRIAYPRAGSNTGLALTVPDGPTDFQLAWDADLLRTRTYAVGDLREDAAEEEEKPVVMVDRPQPGRPRLDAVDDHPGTVLQTTLTEKANTAASQYADPVLAITATVTVASPPLGAYAPGDSVAVRIRDELLPGGLEVTARLQEISVNAADATVSWTVMVPVPPPKPRETYTSTINRLSRLSRGVFRRNLEIPAGSDS